jgi:hypothetical protein
MVLVAGLDDRLITFSGLVQVFIPLSANLQEDLASDICVMKQTVISYPKVRVK